MGREERKSSGAVARLVDDDACVYMGGFCNDDGFEGQTPRA
jgi:hypothetical protein